MNSFPSILFIVGPTAVGKSAVALRLGERFGGEIVCCDSMQVYREISIASSRPDDHEITRVPHHLFGSVSVYEQYDVARYSREARKTIAEVMARNRLPVVVGGSGLYMQALIDGIFEGPSTDPLIRMELEERARRSEAGELYEELQRRDPQSAVKIHPHDHKRVIRALEVVITCGAAFSELRKHRTGLWGSHRIRVIVLNRQREDLYRRVNQRVDVMVRMGLVDEIRALDSDALSLTAGYLIGVREVLGFLRGESTLEAAREVLQRNTRRYVKRQLTWFRKDPRWEWLDINEDECLDSVTDRVIKILKEDHGNSTG
jgi:tRNA dimethylallyltransferase